MDGYFLRILGQVLADEAEVLRRLAAGPDVCPCCRRWDPTVQDARRCEFCVEHGEMRRCPIRREDVSP